MQARLTGIWRDEVLRYLGYRGGPLSGRVEADLARCEEQLFGTAKPRAAWRQFSLRPDGRLEHTDFRPEGKDVRTLLRDCRAVILMGVTLGAEVDALLRRAQVRDMADAVILDACASAAVENVCDNLCADLQEEAAPMFLTDRFSPGYGDLPFSQQAQFCQLLDLPRRIGVSLSSGGMMVPQKSVTALIGVSEQPQPKRRDGCASCVMLETCSFRKEGHTCEAF